MLRFPQRFVLSSVACALLVAVGLVAWVLATGSSQAQAGTMQNCPAAGKWSIAVWDGPDGTETGAALATCGAVPVAAAYYLDPQTGGWLGWFRGRPEVSKLATLDDMQGVLALGSATGPVVTATPSGTPTAAPTPTPTGQYSFTFASFYSEPDTFRGTVEEIRTMDSIPDPYFSVTPPAGGQFAVVLMRVTNIGSDAAGVRSLSFRLRDDQDRVFGLAEFAEVLNAQSAAEAYFDRHGLYDTVMPGITLDMVFVFLVPTGTTGLVAERCDASCSPF